MILKLRNGCQWSTKKAHHLGYKVYNSKESYSLHPCPICGGEDGGTHMAGQCKHPHIKGIYIKRHDETVHIIAKAISNKNKINNQKNTYMILDTGSNEDSGINTQGKRIPGDGCYSR